MSMKYVKLFENWLYEAEEGQTEVKPFDPAKPFETRIVDITNDDFSKADEKQKRVIIGSILAKCFDKSEKVTESKIRVTYFKVDAMKTVGNTGDMYRFDLKSEDGKTAFITCKNGKKLEDASAFYIVTLSDDEIVSGTYKDEIQPKSGNSKRFILVSNDKGAKGDDFVLNSNWIVYDFNKDAKETTFESTLGNVAALATTKLENVAILKDANAGKPESLAKALGYEIPANYAPGKGVEAGK